jgi:7-cyano-7-deazaguanine synthase
MGKKAVVLVSGGLDSAVALYLARAAGYACECLAFDYGQRHARELRSASQVAAAAKCPLHLVRVPFFWKGSSLLDTRVPMPSAVRLSKRGKTTGIPSTYVPARNLVFLSLAVSFAEARKASAVFIGAHAQDYSGYPDCRPGFFRAFERTVRAGTKAGAEGSGIEVQAPLLRMGKAQIIRTGIRLGVPFQLTWSCYRGGVKPCGTCESCLYRAKGFAQAGALDPIVR